MAFFPAAPVCGGERLLHFFGKFIGVWTVKDDGNQDRETDIGARSEKTDQQRCSPTSFGVAIGVPSLDILRLAAFLE